MSEESVEVEIATDEKGAPVIQDENGKAVLMPDGEKLNKVLFFGKDKEKNQYCKDTFHGKGKFFEYMAVWYADKAAEHWESKDPKTLKQLKAKKLRKMLAALEAEIED